VTAGSGGFGWLKNMPPVTNSDLPTTIAYQQEIRYGLNSRDIILQDCQAHSVTFQVVPRSGSNWPEATPVLSKRREANSESIVWSTRAVFDSNCAFQMRKQLSRSGGGEGNILNVIAGWGWDMMRGYLLSVSPVGTYRRSGYTRKSLVSVHHRQISVEQQAKLASNFQQDNAYSEWWCDSNGWHRSAEKVRSLPAPQLDVAFLPGYLICVTAAQCTRSPAGKAELRLSAQCDGKIRARMSNP